MRQLLMVFSLVIAAEGLWVLIPQLLNPSTNVSIGKRDEAACSADAVRRSELAARIGAIRGDLWANYFYCLYSPNIRDDKSYLSSDAAANALKACDRALSAAPVSPILWALCARACSSSRLDCTGRFIRMSFYTGPYVKAAASARLDAAVRLDLTKDPEIEAFVIGDIRLMLTERPALKSEVLAAYNAALPQNRLILSSAITETDSSLLGGHL